MPGWTFLLLGAFIALGLRTRRTWNANTAMVGITVVVLLAVAVKEHLLLA
jgi:hypothetical protein